MAGKTKIDGTVYAVNGGKTKIDGTVYNIKGGKTKIDGTVYSINFGVDLAALFRGMTVLHVEGRNGSSRQGINFYAGDYVSKGGTAYVLSFFSGDMSIFKVVIGSTITPIYRSNESYAGLSMSYGGIIAYYHGVDTTPPSSSGYNTTSVNGATLALVQFNQPEDKVDAALGALQYVTSHGNNSSSKREAYVGSYSNSFYFVANGTDFSINYKSTSDLETLFSTYSSYPSLLYYYSGNYWYSYSGTVADTAYGSSVHVAQYAEQ